MTAADATDVEIESFYQDNSELIRLLLHLAEGTAYNPSDTAGVSGFYAKFFWAGVRGSERMAIRTIERLYWPRRRLSVGRKRAERLHLLCPQ